MPALEPPTIIRWGKSVGALLELLHVRIINCLNNNSIIFL